MALRRYSKTHFETFLVAVDRALRAPASIVLIGGGALALGYGVDNATQDLDTFQQENGRELERAAEAARAATGLSIPVSPAAIADLPYHYEDRLVRILPTLAKLSVWVVERHDLVLSKMVRGQQHDLDHIVALHTRRPLDKEVLLERYLDEMTHTVAPPRDLDINFLNCIEAVFGDLERSRARRTIAEGTGRRHKR